jgi:biotin-dependent carboxylase-like uncharacterized protein
MSVRLKVRGTGPLSLVEDLGRSGASGIGVGRSGAADRASLRRANRAVANAEDAAALEVTLGGLEVEVVGGTALLCLTGAPCPVSVDGRQVGAYAVFHAPPGSVVRVGAAAAGLRSYLAVRGGIDVPEVLGSRSHDVMAGLGPAPLAPGDELPVGRGNGDLPVVDALPPPSYDGPVVLRAVRGPRDRWVQDADLLVATEWTATDRSNRVGMRLAGETLAPVDADRQLPSEGACRGAVQVPPSGEPVVFLADHPVTGGYPVVAVVVDEDVDRAAQVRPGQALRFRWVAAP